MYRLLLVDDDKENLEMNKEFFTENGYKVSTAENGEAAIKKVTSAKADFALVLMDIHMSPGISGVEAITEIKKIKPNQMILAFSMDDTRQLTLETFRAGVVDFVDKNSDNDVLLARIQLHCKTYEQLHRVLNENHLSDDEKTQFIAESKMVGRSRQQFELCKDIRVVAPTQATALILGESGTGKELVARAIHNWSSRAKCPFVAFNIASENPSLLDSSLFGHKKGSFTGATEDQPGKFKLANGGTIFLDEIGDLGLDLQVKLLRVLQEREISPVGAPRPVPIDVRIVAATHRNLEEMVSKGTFRQDLYYRLNCVVLVSTPLRERPDDIVPLILHFTKEVCKQNGFSKSFQAGCLEIFKKYSWPGNIRELRSIVERHLIRARGDVRPEDLDISLRLEKKTAEPETMDEITECAENYRKACIQRIMNESGSRAEAARRLKIAPSLLHYFITKWSLQ